MRTWSGAVRTMAAAPSAEVAALMVIYVPVLPKPETGILAWVGVLTMLRSTYGSYKAGCRSACCWRRS
ncbi:MAG: hypothetical protein GVY30_10205 [Chloroflexi bacterium]|nr:hypothetical protein [Chloroflexota bacterium]